MSDWNSISSHAKINMNFCFLVVSLLWAIETFLIHSLFINFFIFISRIFAMSDWNQILLMHKLCQTRWGLLSYLCYERLKQICSIRRQVLLSRESWFVVSLLWAIETLDTPVPQWSTLRSEESYLCYERLKHFHDSILLILQNHGCVVSLLWAIETDIVIACVGL